MSGEYKDRCPNVIQDIGSFLGEELKLFRIILQETTDFIKELDRNSLDKISKFLEERKKLIDQLKFLELQNQLAMEEIPENIKEEIGSNIKFLLEVDAKLLEFLKIRKQAVIKDLAQVADNKSRGNSRYLKDESKIIDLIQE